MHIDHVNEYLEAQETLLDKWWRKGLPDKRGVYWLYSYRYGKKNIMGPDNKPELSLLEVWMDGTGSPMHVCDGQFLYASEVEESYWRPLELPTLPNERNVINENEKP